MPKLSRIIASVVVPLLSFGAVVGTGFSTWTFDSGNPSLGLGGSIKVRARAEIGELVVNDIPHVVYDSNGSSASIQLYEHYRLLMNGEDEMRLEFAPRSIDLTFKGYAIDETLSYELSWTIEGFRYSDPDDLEGGSAAESEFLNRIQLQESEETVSSLSFSATRAIIPSAILDEDKESVITFSPVFEWKDGQEPTITYEYWALSDLLNASQFSLVATIRYAGEDYPDA